MSSGSEARLYDLPYRSRGPGLSVIRIAAIGDIHGSFNETDIEQFSSSNYDLVLVVGDLPGRSHMGTNQIARQIAQIQKPVFFMPGNHDGVSTIQLLAEIKNSESIIQRAHPKQFRLCESLRASLAPATYCGYSLHHLKMNGFAFDLLCARPHSMGGNSLAFRPYLTKVYGVGTLAQSAEKLKRLIDDCTSPIVVLSHNGPTGLGAKKNDIFGCDFKKEEGDFGDPDLADALDYAHAKKKNVLGVIAGHMHHRIVGGGHRTTIAHRGDVLCINAAKVPRIFKDDGVVKHHHVQIELGADFFRAEHVFWPG